MLSNRSFSLRPVAPYHFGAVLFSVQTHPWLEDPISLLAVVIAYVHRFQAVGLCVPVRGDSFTGGGGTVSSCGTLRVNALTFHNKLIHRDGSIHVSLQLETYKSLLGISSYRLASSLPNN